MRGGGAPRAPCHGFRRGGPGVTGRPRARGLTHPCADASASPWRATRHRSAFAFTAAGPHRGLTPAGLPGGRPLYVAWRYVESHAHGYRIPSHPSNASRSSAPRGGRNGGNIGTSSQLVKHESRKMTISLRISVAYSNGEKKSAPLRGVPTFFAQ